MRGGRASAALVVCAALTLCSLPSTTATASPAAPTRADRDRARALYKAGAAAYGRGHYETALVRFQEAQATVHSPALYFNMAACEEQLHHFRAAALLLRQYLLERTDAPDRRQIEERIESLDDMELPARPRPRQADQAPEPPTPVQPERAEGPSPAPGPRRTVTWAMAGVTGGLTLAAITLGAWATVEHNDLRGGCSAPGAAGCTAAQVSSVHTKAVATDVLIGVAVAAAATTVVLYFLEPRLLHKEGREGKPPRVAFTPGGLRF